MQVGQIFHSNKKYDQINKGEEQRDWTVLISDRVKSIDFHKNWKYKAFDRIK